MSAANAAAIRRRANIQTPPAVSMPNSQTTTNNINQTNSQKPTLIQYITTLFTRNQMPLKKK